MFEEAGLPCPSLRNPTDHFLHVINRDFKASGGGGGVGGGVASGGVQAGAGGCVGAAWGGVCRFQPKLNRGWGGGLRAVGREGRKRARCLARALGKRINTGTSTGKGTGASKHANDCTHTQTPSVTQGDHGLDPEANVRKLIGVFAATRAPALDASLAQLSQAGDEYVCATCGASVLYQVSLGARWVGGCKGMDGWMRGWVRAGGPRLWRGDVGRASGARCERARL